MFGLDSHGDASLVAVREMSAMLKHNSFNVPPAVLATWLKLKLDGASAEAITKGGSDRSYYRITPAKGKSMILSLIWAPC